jgi:hypothetical protein
MVFAGVADWEDQGSLRPTTRARAGEVFVQLYQLQEATLGQIDFAATARMEGKQVIMRRYGTVLAEHYGAALSGAALDAVLDEIVGHPLGILAKVTEIERALAN